jgi:hypothetical protein
MVMHAKKLRQGHGSEATRGAPYQQAADSSMEKGFAPNPAAHARGLCRLTFSASPSTTRSVIPAKAGIHGRRID